MSCEETAGPLPGGQESLTHAGPSQSAPQRIRRDLALVNRVFGRVHLLQDETCQGGVGKLPPGRVGRQARRFVHVPYQRVKTSMDEWTNEPNRTLTEPNVNVSAGVSVDVGVSVCLSESVGVGGGEAEAAY